tara:strand:+ start:1001 stop:1438 length:438 start_codon:yes stop_codon:yes gene_type:complete
MDGVSLTPLKKISNPKGDIFHVMKKSDEGFDAFGEAYFSTINCNEVKGWKKHARMTLNLVVPVGEIQFIIYDERLNSLTQGKFFKVLLSVKNNYQRLTIAPGLWVGFKGVGKETNILLNIASIEHDSSEAENRPLDSFYFDWGLL